MMRQPLRACPSPPDRMATSISSNSSESSVDNSNYSEEEEGGIASIVAEEPWRAVDSLVIVVFGASGDLAKRKTYPSLLDLFHDGLLPDDTVVWGYARSNKTLAEFRSQLKPHLDQRGYSNDTVEAFLECCYYQSGRSYGDVEAYERLTRDIRRHEASFQKRRYNRLFYLAVPPNVFGETGATLKKVAWRDDDDDGSTKGGWSRVVIEKPFGRDLESCRALSRTLRGLFEEHHMYRIDHYLGKEVVQNLLTLRFGNAWLEWMWHRSAVEAVVISFREDLTTQGRGGYFDSYGIIRDVMQNHLLQVLCLVAMEAPLQVDGPQASESIRDHKVQVLQAMSELTLDDCLLGQYEGYADDPTISKHNKDTNNTPTYAALRCFVHTPRWAGVPFILEAGKALQERSCHVRIQFKPAPVAARLFSSREDEIPRNELVMRLQPSPAIFMTTNIKTPGFASKPTPVTLGMDYQSTAAAHGCYYYDPDAYTRLILDVLRGRQGFFVREDELERSWEIFTPLLHTIEREHVRPVPYTVGSLGPAERAAFFRTMGALVEMAEDDAPFSLEGQTIIPRSAL